MHYKISALLSQMQSPMTLFLFSKVPKIIVILSQPLSVVLCRKNYSVYCDLVDEAGAIATLATIMASHNISIKNIGILHNREYEDGVLQIEFYEEDALEKAVKLMEDNHYVMHRR